MPDPMTPPAPVRLLTTARAPNPRRVGIFLAEKGITLPAEEVDIMKEAHRDPGYVQKAGAAVVPVLELADGTVLTESVAICRYIEALHPEPNLMGRDPLEQAVVEMWQRRMELGLFLAVAQHFRHTSPAMAHLEDQVPEWGENCRGRIFAALQALDQRLAGREFVALARYTIADITAQVALDFMRVTRIAIPEDHVHLRAWKARVDARPSAAAGTARAA